MATAVYQTLFTANDKKNFGNKLKRRENIELQL